MLSGICFKEWWLYHQANRKTAAICSGLASGILISIGNPIGRGDRAYVTRNATSDATNAKPIGRRQKLLCCRANATNVSIQNRIGADQMPLTFCKKTKKNEEILLSFLDL